MDFDRAAGRTDRMAGWNLFRLRAASASAATVYFILRRITGVSSVSVGRGRVGGRPRRVPMESGGGKIRATTGARSRLSGCGSGGPNIPAIAAGKRGCERSRRYKISPPVKVLEIRHLQGFRGWSQAILHRGRWRQPRRNPVAADRYKISPPPKILWLWGLSRCSWVGRYKTTSRFWPGGF